MNHYLKPDSYFPSLNDVPIPLLQNKGVRLILLDIDNTLSIHGSIKADRYATQQIKRFQNARIQCILFSNALQNRVKLYADSVGIDFVPHPKKPSLKGIQWVLDHHPNYREKELAIVGDQIFTDVIAGKRAGILTILVDPLSEKESFHIELKRCFEKLLKTILRIQYDR
jgi:uncharacterized protein